MALDDEDKKFITDLINQVSHKAATEREKRFETRLTSIIDEKVAALEEATNTRYAEFLDELAKEGATDSPSSTGDDDIPDSVRAQMSEMRKLAEDAKAKADKWEKTAREKEAEALRAEEITALQAKLTGSVRPEVLDVFVAQLHGRHVVRDKANPKVMLWKKDDGEMLPLEAGIKEWTESDAGKAVRPPVDASGSGGRGPSGAVLQTGGQVTIETLGAVLSRQR